MGGCVYVDSITGTVGGVCIASTVSMDRVVSVASNVDTDSGHYIASIGMARGICIESVTGMERGVYSQYYYKMDKVSI
jgi:hypothetical protein